MGITKVWIESGCIACGNCEGVCPSVFKVEDVSTIVPGADLAAHEDCIKTAAEECPVQVIKYDSN